MTDQVYELTVRGDHLSIEGIYETEDAAKKAVVNYLYDQWNHAFPERADGDRAILSVISDSGVLVIRPQHWNVPPEFHIAPRSLKK